MNNSQISALMSEYGKKSWAARKAKMGKNTSKIMASYALKKKTKSKSKKLSTP